MDNQPVNMLLHFIRGYFFCIGYICKSYILMREKYVKATILMLINCHKSQQQGHTM